MCYGSWRDMSRRAKKSDKKSSRTGGRAETKKKSRFLARWFLLVPAVLVLFSIVLMSWYYEPAKIWYRETRQERVLRETLVGIQDYNSQLRDELSSLETTAGVQDFAARELGLVVEGDQSIVVTRNGVPIREPRTTREAVVTSIPDEARPFGAWTYFLDTLFDIE